MVAIERITESDSPLLAELLPTYLEAFPPNERRDEKQLKRLIRENSSMYFNAVFFDAKLAGLFVYWDMDGFFFLEHLAILPNARNHKVGQKVLSWAAINLKGIRLMEVEPSGSSEFSDRRIEFYQRNGYKVLDKSYQQPSYCDKAQRFSLWIMGNQDIPSLSKYVDKIITEVYTRHCP